MTNRTINRAILPVCFSAGGTPYIMFQHENGNDQEMMFQKKMRQQQTVIVEGVLQSRTECR